MTVELLLIIGIAAFVSFFRLNGQREQSTRKPRPSVPLERFQPYKLRDSILTATELKFYHVLRQATAATICIKPRIADVLETPRGDRTSFRSISQKHCDFLLCEPATLRPILAIELDDYTHNRPDRQARDQFVDQAYHDAGLPILHVKVNSTYDLPRLRDEVIRTSWKYHSTPPLHARD